MQDSESTVTHRVTDSDRRYFMRTMLGGALAFSGAAYAKSAADQIGVTLAMSGVVAAIGQNVSRGIKLRQKDGLRSSGGVPDINVILRDDGGGSDTIKRIIQEFVVRNHVNALAGAALSPQAFAIAPLITEARRPFVIMSAATSSITLKSRYFVRVSYTMWQHSYTLGQWAARQKYRKAYVLVADYAAGLDGENAFSTAFKASGGEVVGSIHAPMNTADYLPYMQKIRDSDADTLFMFINAGHGSAAVAAYAAAGLREKKITLMGPGDITMDDDLLTYPDSAVGMISADIYYTELNVPGNKVFMDQWRQQYGKSSLPNFQVVSGWDGMGMLQDMFEALGSSPSAKAMMSYLANWKTDQSPRGAISIDPDTRDIVQNIYINEVIKDGDHLSKRNLEIVPKVKDPWKILNNNK